MTIEPQPIQWIEQNVHLRDLKPFEHNPRTITEKQYEKLKTSLLEAGYHSRIKATPDLRVIGGHQRIRALRELGYDLVAILVPDRALTDEQFKKILLTDNHNNGAWDMDMLSAYADLEELREIGLHEVMNIPPMDDGEPPPAGKTQVCCPKCKEVFPVKGNKAEAEK